jgi:hypothetical protein
MKRGVLCKETKCTYFRQYYKVVEIARDIYTPRFECIDNRCKHPSVCEATGTLEDNGIRIKKLKACPNEKDIR